MDKASQAGIALDRSSAQPLYAQIALALRHDIDAKRLAPGAALPSEATLCRQFGVARSVVRQALAQLAASGLIHREAGRAPIVAAPVEHRRIVQRSTGLFEQFASTGTALRTQVLRLEPANPPPPVAAFFGTDDTLVLERVRGLGDGPLAFVRTWLPRQRVPGLGADELHNASLHRTITQRYGLLPGRGRNQIRAVGADAELAHVLRVTEGSPLLMLEGQGLDQHEQPLEWFTTWHRAEQLVFDVDVDPGGEQIQLALPEHAPMAGRARGLSTTPAATQTALSATPAATGEGMGAGGALADLERALTEALENVRRLRRGAV
ncbi:GntR family transcriptional regulator [Paracandidimonas lactea]|uniref:GntR family transcriptional regulator n=1 Tax=Paracandidimonas lactea TaxID=2895524 RepID=UPI001F2C1A3B|nr:GntR family transcriptional regulator [Paracandidimonas lactea]